LEFGPASAGCDFIFVSLRLEKYHLKFIDDYGLLAAETIDAIEKMNIIPVDLDLSFNLDL
jgi:hypothetical protein